MSRPEHRRNDSLSDQQARVRIRTSLDESLIVEAAAGTGKTSELVRRIVSVLQSGRAAPDQVVAVTFTRKAAGELKLRIRRELDRAREAVCPESERRNLENAISTLEEAHIGTIHSFCGELLRSRPVEAGIDPGFEELGEEETGFLFDRVVRPWIEHAIGLGLPGLERVLSRAFIRENDQFGLPVDQIREAAWKLAEWRDFPADWRRPPGSLKEEIDNLVVLIRDMGRLASLCHKTGDPLVRSLSGVLELVAWVNRADREGRRDYSRLEAQLVELAFPLERLGNSQKGFGKFSQEVTREEVLEARKGLAARLLEFKKIADADLAGVLQSELKEVLALYEKAKHDQGKLDFLDLLLRTRDLLRDNSEVRQHFQSRFTHLFVDEFQDTDPLQAEILLLLASEDPAISKWEKAVPSPGKLFLVGDPKQSIYRFRRADVILYLAIRDHLIRTGVPLIRLSQNFRSVRSILRAVNSAFEPEMREDSTTGQAGYVPLDPVREDFVQGPAPVIALPVPVQLSSYGNITIKGVEEALPGVVAAFVDWLLNRSGWTVTDPAEPGLRVPILARHVALLFRRFASRGEDVTRAYTRPLEARGIPHVLAGSRSFHRREEVETLRIALTAIEHPDDELAVYATLRGSLFALPDRLLLWYRDSFDRLAPLRGDPSSLDPALSPVKNALDMLAGLHRSRNYRPFAETLVELLERTRAHAGFALRPAGHQVLANLQRFIDLVRQFEVSGGLSFRALISLLETEAARGTAESPVIEEGMDGVRLMTVHGAKGLEFPIVILADLTCKMNHFRSDRTVEPEEKLAAFSLMGCRPLDLLDREALETERDRAESVRIAYVAATRARDVLVVPAVEGKPWDGWLQPLNKCIYADRGLLNSGAVERTFDSGNGNRDPAGGNTFDSDGNSASPRAEWWDTATLDLKADLDFGIRQAGILAEDNARIRADQGLAEHQDWCDELDSVRRRGIQPSLNTATVSARSLSEPPPNPVEVMVERIRVEENRPTGPRFGTLVHAMLRDSDLDGPPGDTETLASFHGRLLGVTPEESETAIRAVKAVLVHPLLVRARAAHECRREWPFLLKNGNEELLEGVLDLAFRDGENWVVVDFKTDLDRRSEVDTQVRQVQWYAAALKELTGLPVEGWLLGV